MLQETRKGWGKGEGVLNGCKVRDVERKGEEGEEERCGGARSKAKRDRVASQAFRDFVAILEGLYCI